MMHEKNSPLSRMFVRGSTITMIATVVIGVLNYFVRRTMALNLSEIDYGFIYSALSFLFLLLAFLDLGLSQAGTILMSKEYASGKKHNGAATIYSQIFYGKLTLALLSVTILCLLSSWLTNSFFQYPKSAGLFCILSVMVLFQSMESAASCALDAKKAFVSKNMTSLIRTVCLFGLTIVLVPRHGFQAAIYTFVIAAFIGMTATLLTTGMKYQLRPSIQLLQNKTNLKALIHTSGWIAISTACLTAMYYMDTLCLTWIEGLESVALYNIALPIMQIIQCLMIFPLVFTPIVSEMWHHHDRQGIQRICTRMTWALLGLLPVITIIGVVFSEGTITLLFSEKFTSAAPALNILLIAMILFTIANFYINTLNAIDKGKTAATILVSGAGINLLLNILLIPALDIRGAATATAITYLMISIISGKKLHNAIRDR